MVRNEFEKPGLRVPRFISSLKKKVFTSLAVLGLCCYAWAFSSCSCWGPPSGCRAQASHCDVSLLTEHGL